MDKKERALKKRKQKILEAVKKSQKKTKKQRMKKISQNKLKELEIEQMKPQFENREKGVGAPRKITPEIEKMLFGYYAAGASLSQIHKQFGQELGFSYDALINARDFYLWEQRQNAIRNLIMNDNILNMTDRFKDYLSFMDDLVSDAIIRFADNSAAGRNSNPFNSLKISNMHDLKTVVELMVNLANGGVKRHAVAVKGGMKHEHQHEHSYKDLSDKKASKLLEILAADEDELEEK